MDGPGKRAQSARKGPLSSRFVQLIRSRSLSMFKAIALISFGLFCFMAGYKTYEANDTVVNRGRKLFDIRPVFYYNNRHSSTKSSLENGVEDSAMPSDPDPWIQEIADLMGEFYRLFQKMRYISDVPGAIAYPPHTGKNRINLDIARKYRLEQQVIDLLQLLPYVPLSTELNWGYGAGDREFLLYGAFADFREDGYFEQSRDPLYADVDHSDPNLAYDVPGGLYMKPYYVALNEIGNHGVALILDTRDRYLWVHDQISGQADPALIEKEKPRQDPVNINDLTVNLNRPATEVLHDLMNKFKTLEWIPSISHGSQEYDTFKSLYIAHGWPDNFNGTAFDIAQDVTARQRQAEYDRDEVFRSLLRLQQRLAEIKKQPAAYKLEHFDDYWKTDLAGSPAETQEQRQNLLTQQERLKSDLLRELALEPLNIQLLEKEIEFLKLEIKKMPEEYKKGHEERVKKYGY